MKRITLLSTASTLAFISLVASGATGCIGQASSGEGTDESTLVSRRTHDVANGEDPNAAYAGGPARALELQSHATDDGQGPHPEPWLDREGPHPEPWTGKQISTQPDPNDPNGNGNGTGKP
jgi:hypothetical protein